MSIKKPMADKMIRPENSINKNMRVKVKIKKPFMYNGKMVEAGEETEMDEERAVNHMRAGDIERDESLILKIKERRAKEAEAAISDARGDW